MHKSFQFLPFLELFQKLEIKIKKLKKEQVFSLYPRYLSQIPLYKYSLFILFSSLPQIPLYKYSLFVSSLSISNSPVQIFYLYPRYLSRIPSLYPLYLSQILLYKYSPLSSLSISNSPVQVFSLYPRYPYYIPLEKYSLFILVICI